MAQFPFIPSDPKDVVLRPLDKGVQLHIPSQGIPNGAFVEAQNFLIGPGGPTRRPTFRQFSADQTLDYLPFENLQLFWTTAGVEKGMAWDRKFIYESALTGFTGKYWVYNTGTITANATATIEGAGGMDWAAAASEIEAGDIMVLDLDDSGADGIEYCEIKSITDADTLVLTAACVGNHPGGTDYEIRRAFGAQEPFTVDFTVVPGTANKMLFADGQRFLYSYDGATYTDFNAAYAYIPKVVTYFQDRVWIGNSTEGGNEYQQRIRWSNVFPAVNTFTTADYLDLPYQQGALMRLVPMGVYLMAYYYDKLFIGRRSNIYGQPLQFDPIETGNIGLVSTKGVIPWINGHFFVGQDNIYWVSADGINPEGIATPIIRESLNRCEQLWRIRAVHWPQMSCFLFGFPRDEETFETIWAFNYRSKSWSEMPLTGEMLSATSFTSTITYSDWVDYVPYEVGTLSGGLGGSQVTATGGANFTTGPTWTVAAGDFLHITDAADAGDEEVDTYVVVSKDTDTKITIAGTFPEAFAGKSYSLVDQNSTYAALSKYKSYSAIQPNASVTKLMYIAREGELFYFTPAGTSDYGGAGPNARLVTGDLDLDMPDVQKVWTRVSLKLEEPLLPTESLRIDVSVSTNRGRTWKDIGPMTIQENEDEGFLTFRTMGSLARFKFISGSLVEPYTINEIVLKARPMGTEVPGRSA